MTPNVAAPSPDVRKRPATDSMPLIGPGHADKHFNLCEDLRRKQVKEVVHVSDRGTGILGWFSTTISDLFYYFVVWFPRTWWYTLTSLPQLVLDPIGFGTTVTFAFLSTFVLFGSLIARYVVNEPCPLLPPRASNCRSSRDAAETQLF